jgi:hypothetical protein
MTTPSPFQESAKRPASPSRQRQAATVASPTGAPALTTLPVRLGNAGLQRLVQAILRMPLEEEEEPLQRQAVAGPMASAAGAPLEDGVRALDGRGHPLPLSVRN